jgi:colicin import membrane protein
MAKANEVSSKAAAEDKVMQEIESKMHPKEDEDDKTPSTWSLSSDPIDGARSDDDVDNFVEQAEKEGAHVSKEDKETLEEAQRERMVAEEQLIEAKMEAAKVQTQAQEIMKASETRAAEAAAEAKREAQAEIDAAKSETEKVKASAQALLSHQQATEAEKGKLKADLENEKSKEGDIAREAAISAAKMLQEEDNASTSTSESSSAASEEEKATATTETEAESASTGTTQENANVDDEKLPEPWKAVLDSDPGKTYYWNTETQETSWDKPSRK